MTELFIRIMEGFKEIGELEGDDELIKEVERGIQEVSSDEFLDNSSVVQDVAASKEP